MYSVFGWINVGLVVIIALPWAIINMNQMMIKSKKLNSSKILKFLKKLHKPLGALLAVSAVVHGIMALGSLRLHTGTIAGTMVIILALLGLGFILNKKKWIFNTHKILAYVFILLLLVHLIIPSAVYYIFGS